ADRSARAAAIRDPRADVRRAGCTRGACGDGRRSGMERLLAVGSHSRSREMRFPIVDSWVALGAIAYATTRIRIGTAITPLPRRRPWKLAREVTTLDRLSRGRAILGVGLGTPIDAEYGTFGEPTDPRILAERLDEG